MCSIYNICVVLGMRNVPDRHRFTIGGVFGNILDLGPHWRKYITENRIEIMYSHPICCSFPLLLARI